MMKILASLLSAVAAHRISDSKKSLTHDDNLPTINSNQTLFVCNGFYIPEESTGRSATLKHKKAMTALDYEESGLLLTDSSNPLAYGKCQLFDNLPQFHTGERIEVYFSGLNAVDLNGAFEISTTPDSTSTLLLVLERTGGALSFRSFAFPSLSLADNYAQLAVIDAHRGKTFRHAVLSLEDHIIANKENGKAIKKDVIRAATPAEAGHPEKVRLEEIEMDMVYAIEPGTYDADIIVPSEETGNREHVLQRLMEVQAGGNYVIMRTGYDDAQELAFYPKTSGVFEVGVTTLILMMVSVFLF